MRLDKIREQKALRAGSVQPLYSTPTEELEFRPASLYRKKTSRRAKDLFSPLLYALHQRKWRRLVGPEVAPWAKTLSLDGKYRGNLAWRSAQKMGGSFQGKDVLLPGCHFNSAETRDWLATRVRSVTLIDIVDWTESFQRALPLLRRQYRPELRSFFGSLEKLPFPDESFDLIETRAVLEHVGNMVAAAKEMARVLRPGGVAVHAFGPLYFSAGGDHCIGAYGSKHVYDHLLLDEKEYQQRLRDETAFEAMGQEKSDARYWAIQGIFSYLTPQEYLGCFRRAGFEGEAHASLSGEAIRYQKSWPESFSQLISAGIAHEDLLTSGMLVIQSVRK